MTVLTGSALLTEKRGMEHKEIKTGEWKKFEGFAKQEVKQG